MLQWVPDVWLEKSHMFLPRIWLTPTQDRIEVSVQSAPGTVPRELGSISVDQHPRALIGRLAQGKAIWILAIPASQAVIKELRLPVATRHRLNDVLRFELDRHTPFNAESALFGFEELPSDISGAINIRLAATPRHLIQSCRERLARTGVTPDHVVVRVRENSDSAIRLVEHPIPAHSGLRNPMLALAASVALIAAIIVVPLFEKREKIMEQQRLHTVLLPEAQAIAAMDREREALFEFLDRPLRERATRHLMVEILKDLTETIPDDGHLFALRIEDGALRIEGETTSATSLIEPLQALPTLTDVRFLASTTHRGQQERFQIGARLAPLAEALP